MSLCYNNQEWILEHKIKITCSFFRCVCAICKLQTSNFCPIFLVYCDIKPPVFKQLNTWYVWSSNRSIYLCLYHNYHHFWYSLLWCWPFGPPRKWYIYPACWSQWTITWTVMVNMSLLCTQLMSYCLYSISQVLFRRWVVNGQYRSITTSIDLLQCNMYSSKSSLNSSALISL